MRSMRGGVPGAWVVVSNGIYLTGGRTVGTSLQINRVVIDKPLSVRSVNGPEFTIIQGYQVPGTTNGVGAIRCVYLTNGASLSGFTLTNGVAESGGGVFCESATAVVSNCVIAGNSAGQGGGAYRGTLNNCKLSGNSASGNGGGAYGGTLNNCTLTTNSASYGGGVVASTLKDCTLTGNSAFHLGGGAAFGGTLTHCTLIGNWASSGGGASAAEFIGDIVEPVTLNNCLLLGNQATGASSWAGGGGARGCRLNNCTLAGNSAYGGGGAHLGTLNDCILFTNGCCDGDSGSPGELVGYNWIGDPLFVDYAGGNLRLQSNSPCINAGRNAYAAGLTDLDGLPRIVSGTVDIGAYEYQGAGSTIS